MTELQFIHRLFRLIDSMECDDILWSWEGDRLNFHVKCSDLFFWGCADSEDVTPDNIGQLEQAYADVRAITGDENDSDWCQELFCCRIRNLRPQGACYPEDKRLWPLIDACGPEREVGLGNPYAPGEYPKRCKEAVA